MARNKYPEETVEKILEVSKQLFLEKGYENTTIQDIVDHLGGLSKGAIYHHYKSKEDIIIALSETLFVNKAPFLQVRNRDDLNGIEKMQEVIRLNYEYQETQKISNKILPLLENPRIFSIMIDEYRRNLSPLWLELLEEGIKDGSISTEYPRELSEVIPLLGDIWLYPTVYPATRKEIIHKLSFFKDMLVSMGVPVINNEIFELLVKKINEISE